MKKILLFTICLISLMFVDANADIVEDSDIENDIRICDELGCEENVIARGPQYLYKTVYGEPIYKEVSGLAENQLPGGYKFKSGGSFDFSDNGGSSMTFSFTLPAPYNCISMSLNFGKVNGILTLGGSGSVEVDPEDVGHYCKLKVKKTIAIKPYDTYRKRSGATNTEWELWKSGAVPTLHALDFETVRVE